MKSKKIFLSAFLIISTICLHSQVFYTEQGKFGIGFSGSTDYPIYDLQLKATAPIFLMESIDYNKNLYIRMTEGPYFQGIYFKYDGQSSNDFIFGSHTAYDNSTSNDLEILRIARNTGEIKFYPMNTSGYTFTTYAGSSSLSNYAVRYGQTVVFSVFGDGVVYCKDVVEWSDSTLKTDIEPISDSYEIISKLRPVKYHYKGDLTDNESSTSGKEIGLIAQEVEEILPSAVKTAEGKKGISYSSIIPLLIDALQKQQDEIKELKSQMASLGSSKGAMKEPDLEVIDTPTLSQNIPNPFSDITRIKYNIHEFNSQAMINIYDLQGKQIQTHLINSEGQGEILIPGSELDPGIYIYNLIVDGMEIDSKRMVLTN